MLSYNSLTYVQDMKIGHYSKFPYHLYQYTGAFPRLLIADFLLAVKIPPRSLFRAQLFAVLWLS